MGQLRIKHSSSQQRHMPWTVVYMLGAYYVVDSVMHHGTQATSVFFGFGSA